ncbi:MAG: 3-deoxy-manno-octulosonate cytidylyltransferase [Pirellulales bacterium]|nr:3-deoxy-manno-octulosonate cytidylyltransferase [Pirellulales bacterium]
MPANHSHSSYVVIPARLASTRLPRKLLLSATGKTLLQHTYEAALQAKLPVGICIAADHEDIAAAARGFGARVIMTSPACASGTDRLAEVAPQLAGVDLIVNVQGDEPELSGATIDAAIKLLTNSPQAQMATLGTPIHEREKLHDPACVKVVWRRDDFTNGTLGSDKAAGTVSSSATASFLATGTALYFSRSAIPHARDWRDDLLTAEPAHFYQHLGLYVYRREFLPLFAGLPRTPLEKLENLEQLRVLEHGHQIRIGIVEEPTVGIDTPADYAAFVKRYAERESQ